MESVTYGVAKQWLDADWYTINDLKEIIEAMEYRNSKLSKSLEELPSQEGAQEEN